MTYPLHSVNWENVRILSKAHMRAETTYLEAAFRWSLANSSPTGLLRLDLNDLIVAPDGAHGAQVILRRCVAIAPDGSLVDYAQAPNETPLACAVNGGRVDGETQTVYLAVAQAKTRVPPEAHSSQTSPVLESGLLHFALHLTITKDLAGYATLPIASLIRQRGQWVEDETYLPPCAQLRGHYRSLRRCREIAKKATACMEALKSWPQGRVLVFALAPLGTLLDVYQTPRAHLERLTAGLAAIKAIFSGESLPESHTLAQALTKAVSYAQEHAGILEIDERGPTVGTPEWGTAFQYVQDALDSLVRWINNRPQQPKIPMFPGEQSKGR